MDRIEYFEEKLGKRFECFTLQDVYSLSDELSLEDFLEIGKSNLNPEVSNAIKVVFLNNKFSQTVNELMSENDKNKEFTFSII